MNLTFITLQLSFKLLLFFLFPSSGERQVAFRSTSEQVHDKLVDALVVDEDLRESFKLKTKPDDSGEYFGGAQMNTVEVRHGSGGVRK